ncbi:MAG: hypothetical protein ACK476_14630 [Fluviicola sp.]|jgi:hypothetical protein
MKKISIINLILSILFVGIGAYVHFVLEPAASYLEAASNNDYENRLLLNAWLDASDTKMNFGLIALFGGLLSLILGVITAIKLKNVLSFIAILLALFAALAGALHATHMFS